jgi:hypothetical protein
LKFNLLSGLNLSNERKEEVRPKLDELIVTAMEEGLIDVIEERAEELTDILKDSNGRLIKLYNYLDKVFHFMPEEGSRHSKWMYALSAEVASKMGFKKGDTLKHISYSAVLHDIGKYILPGHLMDALEEGDQLPMELYKIIKLHSVTGSLLLKKVSSNIEALGVIPTIILAHHEEIDGNGYIGLRGNEIPLVSQIISVVDSYLAIARLRSYDPGAPHEEVIEELKRCAGLTYDIDKLRRFNENKLVSLRNEDISNFGEKEGTDKYHERLKMKFERNTREGNRLPLDLSFGYEDVLNSDLDTLEKEYLKVRLMPEYQFSGSVVEKFIDFATANPRAVEKVLESHIYDIE